MPSRDGRTGDTAAAVAGRCQEVAVFSPSVRLERPGADAAAVVPSQRLLVPCRPQCSFVASFLPQYEVHPPRGILLRFIKHQDPCGAMLDLVREDGLGSIDKKERGLACWLGGGGADGPQHGLELIVPAPAAGLELLLEGPGLEASEDLRIARSAWPLLLGWATEA